MKEHDEIWKGKFSYDQEDYGFVDEVDFELYLHFDGNEMKGVCYDEEFRDLYHELPKVFGTIDGDKIEFTVTYPVSYSINEEDEIVIDPTKKGHDVIYKGEFDHALNRWRGIWEIFEAVEKSGKVTVYQHYSHGYWELKKV